LSSRFFLVANSFHGLLDFNVHDKQNGSFKIEMILAKDYPSLGDDGVAVASVAAATQKSNRAHRTGP
jgi:hypothetical protein